MVDKSKDFSMVFTIEGEKVPNPAPKDKRFSFSNFSEEFDDHINKSIRGYSTLRNDVVSISKYFAEDETTVLDLGCSEGSMIRSMYESDQHTKNCEYIGIEINDSFSKSWKEEERLKYVIDDITTMEFPNNCSLVTSLFTFQFIPERKRVPLMEKIFDSLIEGGAFVTSEKLLSHGGKVQNMMEFLYYDHKKKYFTEKEISDKEVELRHLAKLTNEDLLLKQLLGVGFRQIQTFWRNFNFVGMICLKIPTHNFRKDEPK